MERQIYIAIWLGLCAVFGALMILGGQIKFASDPNVAEALWVFGWIGVVVCMAAALLLALKERQDSVLQADAVQRDFHQRHQIRALIQNQKITDFRAANEVGMELLKRTVESAESLVKWQSELEAWKAKTEAYYLRHYGHAAAHNFKTFPSLWGPSPFIKKFFDESHHSDLTVLGAKLDLVQAALNDALDGH